MLLYNFCSKKNCHREEKRIFFSPFFWLARKNARTPARTVERSNESFTFPPNHRISKIREITRKTSSDPSSHHTSIMASELYHRITMWMNINQKRKRRQCWQLSSVRVPSKLFYLPYWTMFKLSGAHGLCHRLCSRHSQQQNFFDTNHRQILKY